MFTIKNTMRLTEYEKLDKKFFIDEFWNSIEHLITAKKALKSDRNT